MSKIQGLIKTSIFYTSIALLSACSHKNTGYMVHEPKSVKINPDRDPLAPLNKTLFAFNNGFDTLLGKPTAGLYRGIFPYQIRNRFRDVFQNLREPNNFINALLKGEFQAAGRAFSRFIFNSTIGIGGLYDVCAHWNIPYKRHDFGQTLSSWGVKNGPYLMLPFRGPSNFRDTVGRAVDYAMDPLNLILILSDNSVWTLARDIPEGIDDRSRYIEELDDFKKGSLDYYASVRSAYFQNREGWTHGGNNNSGSTSSYDSLYSEDKDERRKIKIIHAPMDHTTENINQTDAIDEPQHHSTDNKHPQIQKSTYPKKHNSLQKNHKHINTNTRAEKK